MQIPVTCLPVNGRFCGPEALLVRARQAAIRRGIGPLIDMTGVDRTGIPVYASAQQSGQAEIWQIHAAHDFTRTDAWVGACLQATARSFARPDQQHPVRELKKTDEILGSFQDRIRLHDLCAVLAARIKKSDRIAVIRGEEILAGLGPVMVPSVQVYGHNAVGGKVADRAGEGGMGTAARLDADFLGLGWGHTTDDAIVNGLSDMMAAHVSQLDAVDDRSRLVLNKKLPEPIRQVVCMIEQAGLRCYLRYSPNPFGLAFITAYILEPDDELPTAVVAGIGFHADAIKAAQRAIAQAVSMRTHKLYHSAEQKSSATILQAGLSQKLEHELQLEQRRRIRSSAAQPCDPLHFSELPHTAHTNPRQMRDCMLRALKYAGFNHLVRVVLSEANFPVQVVKVIVPGLMQNGAQVRQWVQTMYLPAWG